MSFKITASSVTAVVSLVFALTGFSYNAWRLEKSEENNIIRDAAFETLSELSEFEQVIYANHYDNNDVEGSPRLGWVKVGLVNDLAVLIGPETNKHAKALKDNWAENWVRIGESREAVDALVVDIDEVRLAVRMRLQQLE